MATDDPFLEDREKHQVSIEAMIAAAIPTSSVPGSAR